MSDFIYKYVGSSYLDSVIGEDGHVTLKCSYPKDFNDPYELFLTLDFKESPDALAFYKDVIGEIPQQPTTCFSRSPAVIPMWAHYAQNLSGFSIEFNESILKDCFPESTFNDVAYQDTPDKNITDMLHRASVIGKPRYLYFLKSAVMRAAYFTKATCWEYEQERRMVMDHGTTRIVNDLMLIGVPKECVTGLLCGPRASSETKRTVQDKANQIGCNYFELKTGKSSVVPYFTNIDNIPYVFNGINIERSKQFCGACKEPLAVDSELCSWCEITATHEVAAASRNIFRAYARHGLLDDYINGMQEISRRVKKRSN